MAHRYCNITDRRPYVRRTGFGRHPLDDLALEHEMAVTQHRHLRGQMKQDRCRDVVGKVADDADVCAKRGKIELQHIALMDVQALRWETRTQTADDIAVDFDHVKTGYMFEQRCSECARTRADLYDAVVAPGVNYGDDLTDDAAILQKVLAEPLSGSMRCLQEGQPGAGKRSFDSAQRSSRRSST